MTKKRSYQHTHFWTLKQILKADYEKIRALRASKAATHATKSSNWSEHFEADRRERDFWRQVKSQLSDSPRDQEFGYGFISQMSLMFDSFAELNAKIEESMEVPCAILEFVIKSLSYPVFASGFEAVELLRDVLGRPVDRATDFLQERLVIRTAMKKLHRKSYYARENGRKRELSEERRKFRRRTTTALRPTKEALLLAWKSRKESKENMIRLGGMLHDLECYVDNRLRVNEFGVIVGRNGGIRSYLAECVPELFPHYKTLMRYKAMAKKLRQATETRDPMPTEKLLKQEPRHPVINEIMERKSFDEEDGQPPRETFAAIERVLNRYVTPD